MTATSENLNIILAGRTVRIALERWGTAASEAWIILPALSTVSSRSEWNDFAKNQQRCSIDRLIGLASATVIDRQSPITTKHFKQP